MYRSNQREIGFTLLELLASLAIMLIVSGAVVQGLTSMTWVQGRLSNRTEMHSSVRSATELLEQEIGQAGKVSFPGVVTLAGPVATGSQTVTLSSTATGNSTAGMFDGEQLVIDTGANQETVTLTNVSSSQITASFTNAHSTTASVSAFGGFASGVVPPSTTNGSTGSVLKIYGDVNGDGNMVYVEYTCDTVGGNLYRNSMAYDTAFSAKPALSSGLVLLPNIQPNPGNAACFTYQIKTVSGTDYVVNVAVTLTVQTQAADMQTGQFQQETKALLNVSPRNVFDVWEGASLGLVWRIQPTPASVTNLLP